MWLLIKEFLFIVGVCTALAGVVAVGMWAAGF